MLIYPLAFKMAKLKQKSNRKQRQMADIRSCHFKISALTISSGLLPLSPKTEKDDKN